MSHAPPPNGHPPPHASQVPSSAPTPPYGGPPTAYTSAPLPTPPPYDTNKQGVAPHNTPHAHQTHPHPPQNPIRPHVSPYPQAQPSMIQGHPVPHSSAQPPPHGPPSGGPRAPFTAPVSPVRPNAPGAARPVRPPGPPPSGPNPMQTGPHGHGQTPQQPFQQGHVPGPYPHGQPPPQPHHVPPPHQAQAPPTHPPNGAPPMHQQPQQHRGDVPPEFMQPAGAAPASTVPAGYPHPNQQHSHPNGHPSMQSQPQAAAGAGSKKDAVQPSQKQPHGASPCEFSSYTFPNSKDMLKDHFPLGALFQPLATLQPAPPLLYRAPVTCKKCGGFANKFSKVFFNEGGRWRCTLCGSEDNRSEDYRGTSMSDCPELSHEVVEYLDPRAQPRVKDTQPPCYIFVVDLNAADVEIEDIVKAITDAIAEADRNAQVAIISFSSCVYIHDLLLPDSSSADVIPGIKSLGDAEKEDITTNISHYLVPVHMCKENAAQTLAGMRSDHPDDARALRKRCLGTAMEAAITLLGKDIRPDGRIVVCMSGAPNFGPGAVPNEDGEHNPHFKQQAIEYFNDLSYEIRTLGVTVDVLCGGYSYFHVAVIYQLVRETGGKVLLHENFADVFKEDVRRSLHQRCAKDSEFDVRTSENIGVTQIIGAVSSLGTEEEEYSNRCSLNATDSAACVTVICDLQDVIPEKMVYLQFISEFTDANFQRRLRVASFGLSVVGSREPFLQSVDEEVTGVLIGKRIALRARNIRDVLEVRELLDDEIRDMAVHFGSREKSRFGKLGWSNLFIFPPQMANLPRQIFLLRRGPVLGKLLQHVDDMDAARILFLEADRESSRRLMAPRLLSVLDDGSFEELPMDNLALQSSRVLFLDHHTHMFIWSGTETKGNERGDKLREFARAFAAKESEQRYPCPRLLEFDEGTSMARFLEARLIPAHKDSEEDQVSSFPQLSELTDSFKSILSNKFHETDDESFHEWYRDLFRNRQ